MSGWAYDPVARRSPRIAFALDGRVIAEFAGTTFRPDLLAAGIGDGSHGFEWTLPDDVRSPSPGVLTVRFAADGVLLRGGERIIVRGDLSRSELFGGPLANGIWMPERVDVTPQRLVIEGWAIGPLGAPKPFAITHNGVAFENVVQVDRADIAARFDLPGSHTRFGFRFEAPNAGATVNEHEFAFADMRTLEPFNRHHTMHVIDSPAPIPESAQRKRVSSSEDLGGFFILGASAYTRLDRVLKEYFGKSVVEADSVLDWGCGCGRVFRYFPPERLHCLTGIDIDRDNIAWCRESYPTARFEVVSPRPPSSLPAGAFDLIFGISVFTHLTEENHLEWLAELYRLTRPRAAVLVSIHAETAWMTSGFSLERYAEWRAHGYIVAGKNFDLDDAYADTSLYFNSFVSRRYIYENWSRYFRVLDVLDGAIGNHQDLVVLERI